MPGIPEESFNCLDIRHSSASNRADDSSAFETSWASNSLHAGSKVT